MIIINNKQYYLCLIDTNIISEMVKNNNNEIRNYFELLPANKYIPSFSLFTILELRKQPNLYTKFLDLFSIFPCMIIKSHEQFILEEINFYPDPSGIDPILVASPGAMSRKGSSLKDLLNKAFQTREIRKYEDDWNSNKKSILDGIVSLVSNFPPKGDKYTPKEIREFIEIAGFQQIAFRNQKFAKAILDKGNAVSIDAFPTIKMMLFAIFYKFYADNRKPLISDTFDIIITAPTPYMDAIISEGHFAESIKKIKEQDDFIKNVEVYKLKNIYSAK